MKKYIEVFDYANDILSAVQQGVTVTAKAGNKVNTMTISWGTLGIEWGKAVFTVFVRESRFTMSLLEQNPEFTINIPYKNRDKSILSFCGTKSGANVDKVKELGLTLVEPDVISVPGIKELPLTLECKIIYKQAQDPNAITEENNRKFYPQDVGSEFPGANRDYHTAYYGQIVAAYIIED